MIGSNGKRGREEKGITVIDGQVRRLRADIDQRNSARAIFRQDGGVSGRDTLKDGLFDREMSFVNGRDETLVLTEGGRNDVNICFEARALDAFRIAVAGAAVERKILWADLQNLAVLFEADTRSELDRIAQVIGFNITPAAELVETTAVHA